MKQVASAALALLCLTACSIAETTNAINDTQFGRWAAEKGREAEEQAALGRAEHERLEARDRMIVADMQRRCGATDINLEQPDFTRSYSPAAIDMFYGCRIELRQRPPELARLHGRIGISDDNVWTTDLNYQWALWRQVMARSTTPLAAEQAWIEFSNARFYERGHAAVRQRVEDDFRMRQYQEEKYHERQRQKEDERNRKRQCEQLTRTLGSAKAAHNNNSSICP